MTDDQVLKLAGAIRPAQPEFIKWVLPIATGLAVYFLTGTATKTDDASITLAGLSQQITSMTSGMAELKAELRSMKDEMQSVRVDPFTGSMGIELANRFDTKLAESDRANAAEHDKLSDRIRALEQAQYRFRTDH